MATLRATQHQTSGHLFKRYFKALRVLRSGWGSGSRRNNGRGAASAATLERAGPNSSVAQFDVRRRSQSDDIRSCRHTQ